MQQLAESLERPRKILMMIKAGDPVDWRIGQVRPSLDSGDILIDGGNSHFNDTRRREKELAAGGIRYLGTGVSGGESGALWGPSIMPGGEKNAYEEVRPMFEAIAAKQLRSIRLISKNSKITVSSTPDSLYLQSEITIDGKSRGTQLVKMPPQTLSAFLNKEVTILGHDRIYERVIQFLV